MGYVSLYRKYRPNVFSDMIGQEHICTTLTNQIKGDRIGHAYLFTGSRGTGKTTAAKIFARAINCLDKNHAPCGKCAICKGLEENNIDILEIDAASNNRVDEIRNLRESVKFSPSVAKYKVYIVDEVHMLTDSAFNALLKTLEEPPSHVVFVLATTDVHKLPATILSRCMRFDFRLVSILEIEKHLKNIFEKEKKTIEKDALKFIAMRAEGSVRDALSIADTCISLDKITYKNVCELLGTTSNDNLIQLLKNINDNDCGKILSNIDLLIKNGVSVSALANDITKLARNFLIVKTLDKNTSLLPEQEYNFLQEYASDFSIDFLLSTIVIFEESDLKLKYSINSRIAFETTAFAAAIRHSNDINSINDKIFRLEDFIEQFSKSSNLQNSSKSSQNVATTQSKQSLSKEEKIERLEKMINSLYQLGVFESIDVKQKNVSNSLLPDNKKQSTIEELPTNKTKQVEKKEQLNKISLGIVENKNALNDKKNNNVVDDLDKKDYTQKKENIKKTKLVDAEEIWGLVITFFRKNGYNRFYTLANKKIDLGIKDEKFILNIFEEKVYNDYLTSGIVDIINQAFETNDIYYKLQINQIFQESDDTEIEKIKKYTSDTPITIIKYKK